MFNAKRTCIILLIAVYGLFLSSNPADAATVRKGNSVRIPQQETIDESLYIGGNSVNVDGTVNGDVICGGQDIEITGVVNGDVICAGQSIVISGKVNGNVRVAGQSVRLSGTVDRNVNIFGQHITVSSGSAILGEMFVGGQNADIDGTIAKKLSGGAQSMNINGIVGDVDVHTQSLVIGSTAIIQNNLTYTSEATAEIARKESIQGNVVKHNPPVQNKKKAQTSQTQQRAWRAFWGTAKVASLISHILLALLIIYFLPKRTKNASLTMQERVGPSFGWGALILVLTPPLIVLFIITIIGIPLAMILLLLYFFSFFISSLLSSLVVGRLLLQQFWADKKENGYWAVAIGMVVLALINAVPFIGGLVSFVITIWGLGGVYYLLRPPVSPAKKSS